MATIRNWKTTLLGVIVTVLGLVVFAITVMAIGNWAFFAREEEEGSCEGEDGQKNSGTSILDYVTKRNSLKMGLMTYAGWKLFGGKSQPTTPALSEEQADTISKEDVREYSDKVEAFLKGLVPYNPERANTIAADYSKPNEDVFTKLTFGTFGVSQLTQKRSSAFKWTQERTEQMKNLALLTANVQKAVIKSSTANSDLEKDKALEEAVKAVKQAEDGIRRAKANKDQIRMLREWTSYVTKDMMLAIRRIVTGIEPHHTAEVDELCVSMLEMRKDLRYETPPNSKFRRRYPGGKHEKETRKRQRI